MLLGPLIASPALTAWSICSKRVKTLSIERETLCDEFLRRHHRYVDTIPVPEQRAAGDRRG
jgi:hypothetical protein